MCCSEFRGWMYIYFLRCILLATISKFRILSTRDRRYSGYLQLLTDRLLTRLVNYLGIMAVLLGGRKAHMPLF